MKISKPKYLEKALLLTPEEQERVLSRMSGKLPRRLEKDRLSIDEAIAIQLEIEDEQLNEWRQRMHALKKSIFQEESKAKARNKAKPEAKEKAATKTEEAVPAVPKPAKKPVAAKSKARAAEAPAVVKTPAEPKAPAPGKAKTGTTKAKAADKPEQD